MGATSVTGVSGVGTVAGSQKGSEHMSLSVKKLIGPIAVAAFLGALPLAWVYGIEAGANDAARAVKPEVRTHSASLGSAQSGAGRNLPRSPDPQARA